MAEAPAAVGPAGDEGQAQAQAQAQALVQAPAPAVPAPASSPEQQIGEQGRFCFEGGFRRAFRWLLM